MSRGGAGQLGDAAQAGEVSDLVAERVPEEGRNVLALRFPAAPGVAHGADDQRLRPTDTAELVETLRRLGTPVDYIEYSDEGLSQVIEFLRNARSFALIPCECRTRYHRCDNPVDVCFVINDAADACMAQGIGRHVSLEEAKDALRRADEHGLVHLTVYNPQQYVYAVCSCCSCCCHDLQFLKQFGRDDLIAHSEYVAWTDPDVCTHCGDCIEPCVFEARAWEDGQMRYDAAACYGCGLCVPICPVEATVMKRRND